MNKPKPSVKTETYFSYMEVMEYLHNKYGIYEMALQDLIARRSDKDIHNEIVYVERDIAEDGSDEEKKIVELFFVEFVSDMPSDDYIAMEMDY